MSNRHLKKKKKKKKKDRGSVREGKLEAGG
jgi:hypothetical protein